MTINTTPNTPSSSPSSPQPYGSMNQVNSGPAGELYTLSNELIAIYNQLEQLYNEMTVAETKVQSTTITAAADAQRASATAQAWSYGCQAAGSFASAGATLGTTIATFKANSELTTKLLDQDNKLKNLKGINNLKAPPPPGVTVSDSVAKPNAEQPRANDLKNGTYKFDDDSGLTPDQVATSNQSAINTMKPDEYKTFKSNLQKNIQTAQEAATKTQQTMTYTQTSYSQYGDLAKGGLSGLAQGGQATATYKSEVDKAAQQVESGVQSMASGTAETTRQNNGQMYAKVSDAIAAAKQGAQAYAQT